MKLPQSAPARWSIVTLATVLVLLGATSLVWQRWAPRALHVTPGKFPEELVYARSDDDIVNAGAVFAPPNALAKPIAVIWIHGWGVNFYQPHLRDDWEGPRGARLYVHHRQHAHARHRLQHP